MRVLFLRLHRIPFNVLVRVVILLLFIVGVVVLATSTSFGEYLNEEQISFWLAEFRQAWWSPVLLIGLYLLTPFGMPASPLLVAGSTFGPLYGSILNITGLFFAALVSYFVAKQLGREFIVHMTGNRLRRAERYLSRFGFWPLVQTRFLPFPASIVNFGAALAGVPIRLFLFASFIGFIPSTVIHTYFIAELIDNEGQNRALTGALYLGAFVVFNFIIGWSWMMEQLKRRKRYHQLCQQRAERRQNDTDSIEIIGA